MVARLRLTVALPLILASLSGCAPRSVRYGIDVLRSDGFSILRGKRVGLITNHSGCDEDLLSTVDLIRKAPGVRLAMVFSPEHGLWGAYQDGSGDKGGATVGEGKPGLPRGDAPIPVVSLYGKRPDPEMLRELDILVYDIQDVGVRFYTYVTTLGYSIEAASVAHIPIVVLDRPNPIGGAWVEGPMLEEPFRSFVGAYPIPLRYGLTIGELALYLNEELGIGADVRVVRLEGWRRGMLFSDTGRLWVAPSPNMPTPETAVIYPGMCFFEGTNVSEGRGTTRPFHTIGAPWIDAIALVDRMRARDLKGVIFRPVRFVPWFSKYPGEECRGVDVHVADPRVFRPLRCAFALIAEIRSLHPQQFEFRDEHFDRLAGTDAVRKALLSGSSPESIEAACSRDLEAFFSRRSRHLLYPE